MKKIIFLILFTTFLFSQEIFKPLPTKINYDKDIVNLGRELFFDPILSKDEDISCATCHGNYGVDNRDFSLGTKDRVGFINAPTVFNLNFHIDFFWNGRVSTLEAQMIDGPLFAHHEMDNDEKTIQKRLFNSPKYYKLFKEAYSETPSFKKAIEAIAQFELTLITPNAKFDKYLRGEEKLSQNEQDGFELFKSYGCSSCHNGINIGSNSYQRFGNVIPVETSSKQWDDRYKVTKNSKDRDVYKVPSLRNIEKTAPYFHDGSSKNLKSAIFRMAYNNIGLVLEENELEKIEAFLKTLTGEVPKTFKR